MSFYDSAVPAYLQMLTSLTHLLDKAEAYATAKKIEPSVLLGTRLFPDMLPLSKQIQIACDHAVRGAARLAAVEVPSFPDTETSFAEFKQRLAKTRDFVSSIEPSRFDGATDRDVTFPIGGGQTMTLKGQQYLTSFSLPNFYFHATMAHGILRMCGVEIGKRDFLGAN